MSFTDLLDLAVIQAPMAGAQAADMAIAVCNAGGLGSLPCALSNAEGIERDLAKITANTSAPYNVNFFCHDNPPEDADAQKRWLDALQPYFDEFGVDPSTVPTGAGRVAFNNEIADVVEPFAPPVVSFHFGLPPDELVQRVRSWGSKIIVSATTVDEARWLEDKGVDAVIAQGVEAGGHRGMFLSDEIATQVGTFALLPQIVDAVDVPVIAAGGIADERGVAAAMKLGASCVQAGTAYLLCPEATIPPLHKTALTSDRAHKTALTNVFTGRPARSIVTRVMRELDYMNDAAPPFPSATGAILTLRAAAEKNGSDDFTSLWSGQNASHCREASAADVTHALAAGLAARQLR